MGGQPPNDRRTVGDMTTSQVLPSRLPESHALQLAVAGYLARFKGSSRAHAESDLRAHLGWCADRGLDPLAASRPHVELYVRWMQEVRRLKPSMVSRRTSIVAGFYRTAVIDGLLEHSPAEHVRRPHVPADSPTTLGLTHLQLEAPPHRRPADARPVRLRARLPARPVGRRQRDKDGVAAFASDAQDAVAVFLVEVGDGQGGSRPIVPKSSASRLRLRGQRFGSPACGGPVLVCVDQAGTGRAAGAGCDCSS
jgi:hypothetical protein